MSIPRLSDLLDSSNFLFLKFTVSEIYNTSLHASGKITISTNAVYFKKKEQAVECEDKILEKIFFRKEVLLS